MDKTLNEIDELRRLHATQRRTIHVLLEKLKSYMNDDEYDEYLRTVVMGGKDGE